MSVSIVKWLNARMDTTLFKSEYRNKFPIYNHLGFKGPNGESRHTYTNCLNDPWGLLPRMLFMGHAEIFPKVGHSWPVTEWVDEQKVARRLGRVKDGGLVHICIESPFLPGDPANWAIVGWTQELGTGVCRDAFARWSRFLDFCRSCNPNARFGVYGGAVMQAPYWLFDGSVSLRDRWWELQEEIAPLSRKFDVLMSEIYPRSTWSIRQTLCYARHLARAARDVHGKDFIPCLWPEFKDLFEAIAPGEDTLAKQLERRIPGDYWGELLDFVLGRADGIQLWEFNRGEPTPVWDDDAPWWMATQQVLIERGVVPWEIVLGNA